jgi:hypothetical protein
MPTCDDADPYVMPSFRIARSLLALLVGSFSTTSRPACGRRHNVDGVPLSDFYTVQGFSVRIICRNYSALLLCWASEVVWFGDADV